MKIYCGLLCPNSWLGHWMEAVAEDWSCCETAEDQPDE